MMGWRCLLNLDDRIVLWRNTLQLFYESKKPQYIGPFKKAGLSQIVVDHPFMTTNSDPTKPDIVCSGNSGWAALEITTRPESKEVQLNSYVSIDPRGLGIFGLKIHDTVPDVICSRLTPIEDEPYCQLILKDHLRFQNESCIKNERLKTALIEADGMELYKLPNISITLVPEMASKSFELRRGISDIVLQLFDIIVFNITDLIYHAGIEGSTFGHKRDLRPSQ